MNANMRRYLEEDWDEEPYVAKQEQFRKPQKNELAQSRRQTSKEWGKAIAKFHRSREKAEGQYRKP
jgi:hypothetical protein